MIAAPRPLEIIGGGLAGLALGRALARAGVPVTLHDAGTYPRHRVCGEFITGLDATTIATLALAPLLVDALPHTSVAWFRRGRLLARHALPAPALALSRHTLDARLAADFTAQGGTLQTRSRLSLTSPPAAGRILATGRRPDPRSRWIGGKVHVVAGLTLAADLELHLLRGGYVGLCPIEGGRINVCALLPRESASTTAAPGIEFILQRLTSAGAGVLVTRLRQATLDPASVCTVAGLDYSPRARATPGQLTLGDAFGLVPPFTGHGMALALQSAAAALPRLLAYARGEIDWSATVAATQRTLETRFRPRLSLARRLHPWLTARAPQASLALAARCRLLPFRTLYALTH